MNDATIARIMEEMSYGLYIVGSTGSDDVDGMMADWVMQVSFRPRMLAVAFENDARTLQNLRKHGSFTVNVLSQEAHSMSVAARFAQPYFEEKIRGRGTTLTRVHHKLEDVAYRLTASGVPVLDDAMAWLECVAEQFVGVGDHTLVIGRVTDGELRHDGEPLTSRYTGWSYSG
ncbi:MAG TPA: flavin reductase family protein [Dehalococcoidia bacterium]|nr:flavin reductase family protein [Dehalococcoidia bacterium]